MLLSELFSFLKLEQKNDLSEEQTRKEKKKLKLKIMHMKIEGARAVMKMHKKGYSQEQKARLARRHMAAKKRAQPPKRLFVGIQEGSGRERNH